MDHLDPQLITTWRKRGKVITGTNRERMAAGLAPFGYDGKRINLHHLNQSPGEIIEFEATMHSEYFSMIHTNVGGKKSLIDRKVFKKWRSDYWKERAANL
ncbi:MAG: hypothetical protein FJ308_11440 [Planctomycetes bacterium]|nr:hypothetical protein [Planctomycetota bacterium]